MAKEKFRNDATSKLLGYEYQKIIAIEFCLNAKKNEMIWLECKGDIATSDSSIEIKHHIDNNNLTSNSVDVWRTIKTYIIEYDITEQFSSLILQTTSQSTSDSIFYNWNRLDVGSKIEKLLNHKPVSSISVFHKEIANCDKNKLHNILSKFSIIEGQKQIGEKWEELKEHSTFRLIPYNLRDAALEKLYGYISKKAIDNRNEWKVNINDFDNDIQVFLSLFTKGKTPFPIVYEDGIKKESEKKYLFIEKMEKINLKEKDCTNAFADYVKASMSQLKLLQMTPLLTNTLDNYDSDVQREISDEKSYMAVGLTPDELDKIEALQKSQQLYYKCITKPYEQIPNVDNTPKYYRDGRIHHSLETTDFEWKFNEGDL